jgi:beta-glucosidase
MPGPVRRRGQYLLTAHREGHINEAAIDKCAQRVLELVYRTGKYKKPDWKESREQAWDLPQHRKILRRTGAEGMFVSIHEFT